MSIEPIAIILFIGTVITVIIILSLAKDKKRREELATWASSQGFSYFEKSRETDFHQRYPGFDCLRQGDNNRYATNCIQGTLNGRNILAFDYHYETESRDSKGNKSTTSHWFSGVLVDSGLPLKPLQLRPEHLFDRLGQLVGFHDIDFESVEFNKAFVVKAQDRRWACDVIQPATMEFLLASRRQKLAFSGRWVMSWGDSTFSVQEFTESLTIANGVIDRMPDFLVQQLRENEKSS